MNLLRGLSLDLYVHLDISLIFERGSVHLVLNLMNDLFILILLEKSMRKSGELLLFKLRELTEESLLDRLLVLAVVFSDGFESLRVPEVGGRSLAGLGLFKLIFALDDPLEDLRSVHFFEEPVNEGVHLR